MSNYVASGKPLSGSRNISEEIRKEFKLIEDAIATKSEPGGITATSTTNITIGIGVKSFAIQANKEFVPGMTIFLADNASPSANNMIGIVNVYNKVTGFMSITCQSFSGSGTKNSWSIGVSSPLGVTLNSNTFLGAQNFAQSTVASSSSPDIWSANNQILLTGTNVITGFPPAPQAGAYRTLICQGACSFTASASLIITGYAAGQAFQAKANDVINVMAASLTTFVLTIDRADGKPPAQPAVNTKLLLTGANGTGTTNTKIGRMQTIVTNTGEGIDWNYAQSSAMGDTITILRTGTYSLMFFTQSSNSSYVNGISINSLNLAISMYALPITEKFLQQQSGSTYGSTLSRVASINAGSILRIHCEVSNSNSVGANNAKLELERIM